MVSHPRKGVFPTHNAHFLQVCTSGDALRLDLLVVTIVSVVHLFSSSAHAGFHT